jgi:hypothetical protein
MRALTLAALAAAIVFTGCNKKQLRPGFCNTNSDCGNLTCDARDGGSWTCIEGGVMDAPTDVSDGGDTGTDAADAPKPFSCTTTADCMDAGMSGVCEPDAGMCVECTPSMNTCTGTKPICAGTTCVPCTNDTDCTTAPNICMPDGHCATDDEVVYVEFKSAGCPAQDGSAATPFCTIAQAVARLDADRRVIVIRGPADDKLILNTTTSSPIVIGRPNASPSAASIPAGAGTAVTVTAGDVLIRDLRVTGGTDSTSKGILVSGAATKLTLHNVRVATTMGLGIQADLGADLAMDRCYIENNSTGGLVINGASYSIENSVFGANGVSQVQFGGAGLGAAKFRFNTVVASAASAAICDPFPNMRILSESIVVGGSNCTIQNCVTLMPAFKPLSPYHLTDHLACPSTPTMFPARDIDGDPRIAPIDCGADQFVQ